ncbi:cytochrome d ubiquinol oxidase subunit II [Microbispora sp. H11081]|uniref:cytochrome d ubiquinol oxidase subunit II n=1 Tax=Microbispora sp. H11081 TaxID=2729107 RepID=UPI001472AE50|nr:cytochrome d ubiquinol oxidase subunit II [Microbispora sp. H11081]
MDIFWFLTFAVLLAGYFALEGFDIGLGVLLPVLGRSPAARDRLVGAMAPFVLANEVWLVALAGVLSGAFPASQPLSRVYPLVVALLLAWIVRDAGLWFRRRADGAAWRLFWDGALCAGSAGLALAWGAILVAVARGLRPLDAPGVVAGAAGGVALLALFAWHGRTFAAWRLREGPRAGGRALLLSACAAAAPAVLVTAAAGAHLLDGAAPDPALTVLSVMVVPFAPILVGAQVWVWRTFSRGALPTFF